jgi:transcriptional regulator with XRE-family HTH domain/quercetin dioxygenase-like cupin family protein
MEGPPTDKLTLDAISRSERKFAMGKSVSSAQWSLEPYCIGMKLRSLRTQKRLTLARLAAETGLSTALLSKLETDRMVPTLPTLATISRVYGVGMSYFFNEPARHTLSITRKAHLLGQERGMEQAHITPLNAMGEGSVLSGVATDTGHGGPRLIAQMIELPAGGAASASDCFHMTSGLMYVLEGRLQLNSGGLQELLEAGDCAYVESDMAMSWSAAGKRRCRVLAVIPGPQAES